MKIGAMTCCWNEEATIVYTIASLLPFVDTYVVTDTGSTDKTIEMIKEIFSKEIESGRLIFIEYGKLEDYDISKPKNLAIETLREAGCERFIRLDADDVFYRNGALEAVKQAHEIDDDITLYTLNHWELYQNKLVDTLAWTKALAEDSEAFMCMRIPPPFEGRMRGSYGHARIYKTDGAISVGKWTDEAWGGQGEDIANKKYKRLCKGNPDETIVHYGWARPLKKKLEKNKIWTKGQGLDPRVTGLEDMWSIIDKKNIDRHIYGAKYWPRQILFPFTKHPEVVYEYNNLVMEFIK